MNWELIFQHVCTVQVCLLVGAVLAVIIEYMPYALERKLRKRHVLLMGFAYIGLLLLTLCGVYLGVFFHPFAFHEMRIYALISIYITSDFGLYYIFDYVHHINHVHKRAEERGATTTN